MHLCHNLYALCSSRSGGKGSEGPTDEHERIGPHVVRSAARPVHCRMTSSIPGPVILSLSAQDIATDSFKAITDVSAFLGLRTYRFESRKVVHVWGVGVVGRGQFPLNDEGQGLLSVKLRYDGLQELVSFHVGNAEDGHWQVVTGRLQKVQGEETVLKLLELFRDLRALPGEEELLATLQPFGFGRPVED